MPDLTLLASRAATWFTCPELAHDAGQLTRLGNGELKIDLLRRQARHGFHYTSMPRAAEMLRHLLMQALPGHGLEPEQLLRAELDATLRFDTMIQPDPVSPGMGGWCGITGPLVQANMTITVRLSDETGTWQGTHAGAVTWPQSWGERR